MTEKNGITRATVHGHVGLELAGYFDYPDVSPQQMLERALQAVVERILPTTAERIR